VSDDLPGRIAEFWNAFPVAARTIDASPGSEEFFERFDIKREREDVEPLRVAERVHGFSSSQGRRVLDFGCGNGYVLSRYAAHGAEVVGVDVAESAVELTRSRFRHLGIAADIRRMDAMPLPFPDASFDIVSSVGVLHHIADPAPVVRELARVLKPGGTFAGMVYNKYRFRNFVTFPFRKFTNPACRGKAIAQIRNENDGPGCPLARVYSAADVRHLLAPLRVMSTWAGKLPNVELFQFTNSKLGLTAVDILNRLRARQADDWLARAIGWNRYVLAGKD
jgi:SAM-dependent methyltransferase